MIVFKNITQATTRHPPFINPTVWKYFTNLCIYPMLSINVVFEDLFTDQKGQFPANWLPILSEHWVGNDDLFGNISIGTVVGYHRSSFR